jgi:general secretion pathway protein E
VSAIRFPYHFAQGQGILAVQEVEGLVLMLRDDATPEALTEALRVVHGKQAIIKSVTDAIYNQAVSRVYSDAGELGGSESVLDELDMSDAFDLMRIQKEDLLASSDEAPVIRFLNATLSEAIKRKASDIHLEPFEDHLRVRFRMDGILQTVLEPRAAFAPMLISRLKVMARLDIAEKRLPQDGRIALQLGSRLVDLRVSTLPSQYGERVVLRLLDKSAGLLAIDQLGMPSAVYAGVTEALAKAHGIILVTGPTGSGKTTTLYAALTSLNDVQRNIMTVEDPVEYELHGISQTQVNLKTDMTFARGLRAILRQDPDVVMVGEIRDGETAQIAVQASLTGHLVLSTLHTNTAIGAITRLRDMGVEPFLLASSLVGILAQRLVRRLCPSVRLVRVADDAECRLMNVPFMPTVTIFEAGSSSDCPAGFAGRMAVYEWVTVDEALRHLIHSGASEQELEAHVRAQGMMSLRDNGFAQVLAGTTTLAEVLRVTQG